jgi:hypothetical protein
MRSSDHQSSVDLPPQNHLLIALLSGALATAVNMAILATLGAARIRTTHGGLLRLLALGVIRVAHSPGINPTYPADAHLLFAAGWFQEGFHIITGLLMAVVYVFFLEPRRGASPLLRGVLYGKTIWLLNALIVLPAIGEGYCGAVPFIRCRNRWLRGRPPIDRCNCSTSAPPGSGTTGYRASSKEGNIPSAHSAATTAFY